MTRKEKLTYFIKNEETYIDEADEHKEKIRPADKGIEIGPLCTPILNKSEHVKYVDRLSTNELREQYSDDGNVSNETLCEIDFVWREPGFLSSLLTEPFDFAIASHVIEHVPNMIGWLLEIRSVLKPGGILALAIPDRRYTFDYLRQLSTIEQFIEAHVMGFKKASPRMVFDYYKNVVTLDGVTSISNNNVTPKVINRIYSAADALKNAKESFATDKFFDCHNWVFTRESFLEIIGEFKSYNLFPYRVKDDFGVDGCEFIINLAAI